MSLAVVNLATPSGTSIGFVTIRRASGGLPNISLGIIREMTVHNHLSQLKLTSANAIVIGSGILQTLGIRVSNDIDVVVNDDEFGRLRDTGDFEESTSYGLPVLTKETFEIRQSWGVLGRDQDFADLCSNSVIVDGVRYISLGFLLAVKKSWLEGDEVRDKDVEDVRLIETYIWNH
jgi:hypothetical protein